MTEAVGVDVIDHPPVVAPRAAVNSIDGLYGIDRGHVIVARGVQ
jgi:hypothetical protein